VFLAVQTLTPLSFLTASNFVVLLRLLDRKFNEDSKNVPKTVSFLLQVGFTGDFVSKCPFKLCFCLFNFNPAFSLTVPNFVVFFRLLDKKFIEDSKNVLKTVIFSLQVGYTGDFVADCPFKLCFCQFKF